MCSVRNNTKLQCSVFKFTEIQIFFSPLHWRRSSHSELLVTDPCHGNLKWHTHPTKVEVNWWASNVALFSSKWSQTTFLYGAERTCQKRVIGFQKVSLMWSLDYWGVWISKEPCAHSDQQRAMYLHWLMAQSAVDSPRIVKTAAFQL